MAQYDDDAPPEGYRWQYFGDPSRDQASGRYPVPVETPAGEGSGRPIAPHREVAGEVPGTGPSLDQMRFELAQQQPMQDPQSKSLRDTLMNLPLEIRDQAMALGEVGASIFGSMVSPIVGAAAGVGKNLYDYVDKGKIDPAATKDFANTAAGYASYVPTIPSAQHIMQLLGEAPAAIMGTGQGLPPIVSGINPRALQAPRGTTGALTAGVKRDVKQFDNDVFNAQRGITPGYATLGSEFSDAFVTPRPTVYEMLAGLEPSNVPSTASAAVKPKGKGTWVQELSTSPLDENGNLRTALNVPQMLDVNRLPSDSYGILTQYMDAVLADQPATIRAGLFSRAGLSDFKAARANPDIFKSADEYIGFVNKIIEDKNSKLPDAQKKPLLIMPSAFKDMYAAHNKWLEGPGLKYMMTQMGTGLKNDPLLKDIEERNWSFMGEDLSAESQRNAARARVAAQDVHMLDPNYNPLTGDVGSVTTSSDAGRAYENLTDVLIKSMPKSELGPTRGLDLTKISAEELLEQYGDKLSNNVRNYIDDFIMKWDRAEDDNDMPKLEELAKEYVEQLEYLSTQPDLMREYGIDAGLTDSAFARTPEHTPIYNLPEYFGDGPTNPLDVLSQRVLEDLLKGSIDPARISNVSVQRIANELWKDELARRAKVKESDLDYKNWKIEHKAAMPGDDLSDGSKMVIYDDTVEPDVLMRGLSADTWELDHCVADACIDATGDYKGRRYVPGMDPRTGKMVPRPEGDDEPIYRYIDSVIQGESRIASLYDKNNDIQATLELEPGDGPYREMGEDVTQIMGYHDKAVHPAAWPAIVEWLNKNADKIGTVLPSALEHVSPLGLMNIPEGVSPVRKLYPQYKDAGELVDFRELRDITEALPDADYTIDPSALDDLYRFMHDKALRELDDKFQDLYKPIAGHDIPDSLLFLEAPDFHNIRAILGADSPAYAAFEKLHDQAGDVSIATAFENQIGRFFRPNDVKAYAAANGIDLTPQPIDLATANESQLKYRSEYLNRATEQLNLKYNNATDGATHQAITDDMNMIKYEQEAIAKRLQEMTGKDVLGADRPVATYNSDQIAQLRQAVNQYLERGQFDTLQNYDLNLMVYPLLGLDDQNSQLPGNLHRQLVGMMLSPLTTIAEFQDMYTRAGQGALMGSVLDQDQIANAQHILSDWAIAHGHNIKPSKAVANGPAIPDMTEERGARLRNFWRENAENGVINEVPADMWDQVMALLGDQGPQNKIPPDQHWFIVQTLTNERTTVPQILDLRNQVASGDALYSAMTPEQTATALNVIDEWTRINGIEMPRGRAQGGIIRMAEGGQASKEDIMNLKPQPKAQDTSFAQVDSLLADIGRNQEEYERIARGGSFDRKKFTPENIYAMRLLQAANATPDPARYLESLNPYHSSQLQFKLNPFTNVLGYVDPAEPNKAVIQRLEQVENTIPHELTHTLQLGRGAAVEKGGIDKLIEMSRSENLARRKTALPEEMRKSVFPSANVNNAREIWANINARAHLINAAGGDFINSPEGRALFPTNTEQRDYYTNAMPSVNSITPDTGTFVPNRSNPNESYAAKIRRKLGMADGGAVFNPQGADYDYQTARAYGMGQEDGGHWGSVARASEGERKLHGLPEDSYLMLKGAQHPTWGKAVEAETARGSKIVKHGDRYYSVPHKADGGAVTDTLDKMVKNPQASTLLNLDLPNLIAAKRQAQSLKRGGKVQFTNNIDSMRYALDRH